MKSLCQALKLVGTMEAQPVSKKAQGEGMTFSKTYASVAPLRMGFICFLVLCFPPLARPQVGHLRLIVTRQFDDPILTVLSPGAEGNKYGFEGGRVLKLNGTYHLFTSEMVGDPHWVKMKLAHWTSGDRLRWKRASTLFESSGDFTGKDPRAALWSPMPVYDQKEGRWNLFYVAYQCAPSTAKQWLNNYEGRIWRAVSKLNGRGGIDGPYQDVGIILQRGKDSDPWEGLQGTDSFFPYKAGNEWFAFYGTAHTENLPIPSWQVGLASAPGLIGPWKRRTELNPLAIEKVFIENPIVTRLPEGIYVAVYDNMVDRSVGYSFSADGIHWNEGQALVVQKDHGVWASEVRTPLGLVPEGDGTFTLFYAGNQNLLGVPPDKNGIKLTPGAIGLVEVKLERW
ncbi:MAG: hypothetical protein ABSB82_17515 [Terriglobia bacterium]